MPIGEEQFAGNSYDLKEAYDVNYDYQGTQKLSFTWPYLMARPSGFQDCCQPVLWPLAWNQPADFSAFALALGVREDFSKAKLLMHQVSYA